MKDIVLKIETEQLENRQVELTVEVPEDTYELAMKSAARRLGKNTKIPGFRPGKAPYHVLVNRIGVEVIFEEALDSIGQEIYQDALKEAELEPYAPGTLEEIVSKEPLVLRYRVPLSPEVELGDYKDLDLSYQPANVTDEAVEEAMEDLRQRQALIEPADRPAQMTDVLVLDVQGELVDGEGDDDPEILLEEGVSLLLEEDTDWPFAGVAEALLGMEAGESRELEHTFPEDYSNEELAGKQARFKFHSTEVKSRIVPEWSDNLAQNLGEFESLLDLRIKVRENLAEQATRAAENQFADEVLNKVVEGSSMKYPPILVEQEIDDLVQDLDRRLRTQQLSLADYMEIEGKTARELREDLKPRAERRLRRALVLGKVVEEEDLQVGEEEVESRLEKMLEPYGESASQIRAALDNEVDRKRIELELLTEKAVERLISLAKGEEILTEATDLEAPSLPRDSAQETEGVIDPTEGERGEGINDLEEEKEIQKEEKEQEQAS